MAHIYGKIGTALPESNMSWGLKTVNHVVSPVRFYGTETLETYEGTEWKKRLKLIEYLPTRSNKPSSEYCKYIGARILARKRDEFASKWSENGIEESQSNTSNHDISRGIPFLDDQVNNLNNLTVDDVVSRDKIQQRSSISPEVINLDDCSPTIKVSCPTSFSPSSVPPCVDSRSNATTIESEILSPAKKVERDEVRVDNTPEAKITEILDAKNVNILSCSPKAKTPELMDERVGGASRSFVKIPRKVDITLNLLNHHACEAQCINANHKKQQSSTEISAADSSVCDDGNSTFYPAVAHLNKKEDVPISKKPTIVEDVTCLEGTLLKNKLLFDSSRVAINQTVQPKNDVGCVIRKENNKNMSILAVLRRKRTARKIYCCREKSRIRRTFRQLFGSISTSSELDEEDDIVERFLGVSRRKKSRNSSDSGVGLIEINSKNTYVSQSHSEQEKSSEESTRSSSEEMEIVDVQEKKDEPETPLRSMPLLDSSTSTSNSIKEILADNLPDSSTNSSEDSPAQADSSFPEASNTKKTVTIIISPVDVNSSDAFSPLTWEIEIPSENQTLVPTSTTEHLSEMLTIPKIEGNENTSENQDPPNHVDISDKEECKVVPPSPQHSQNQAIVIDNLGSELPTKDSSGGATTLAQALSSQRNEEISLCGESENVTPVPEPEAASSDQEILKNLLGKPAPERDQRDHTNEAITQPALYSSPSMPRIRVLLPSELGSRWCPTPLNITSDSQNVLNIPSGNSSLSAPPGLQYHQPQGTGIPNVQPCQGNGIPNVQPFQGNVMPNVRPGQIFQNPVYTVGSSNAERMAGMYSTNHRNTPNAPTYSQQGWTVQNSSSIGQNFERKNANSKTVYSIFSSFSSLSTCLQLNESAYSPEISKALHNRFKAEKNLLETELHNLCSVFGINEKKILMAYLIDCYEKDFRCSPEVSWQQILTVLNSLSLRPALSPMPAPVNSQTPIYRNQLASPLRPPPPAYQPCPNACCVPRNNVNSKLQYVLPRPAPPANPNQRTFSGMTLPSAPNFPLMTPTQLATLRDQIIKYNELRVRKPRTPRRSKKLPTEKTLAPIASKSVGRVAPIPTLLDPIPRIYPAAQNIQSPIPTPAQQELENIPRLANQINDPRSSENILEDALEIMAAIAQPVTTNSKPDNNNKRNNKNEQQITKMTAFTCSRTSEKSIISETTHPVQEETPYPVEGQTMCSVQEETPYPVQGQTIYSVQVETTDPIGGATSSLEENAKCTVQKETTCRPVAEETTCPVEGEITYPVEEQAMCSIEERTTDPVGRATSSLEGNARCTVEKDTTCPVEEAMTCSVEEETTYPVEEDKSLIGEAMMSLVEEETNYPLKGEMPHSNNTEENDDVSSHSDCEVIEVFDDYENVEEEITTDSKVSVIVLNDSAYENTAIPKNEDTETNFSILEVKSITKDIFDNLGITQEELTPPTSPEATTDDIENHEDSMTNSELRNCLRCGEPSSVVCEQCYEAFYCSSKCHETDWTEHHHLTCKPVPTEALALFEMSWNSQTNLPSLEDELSTK